MKSFRPKLIGRPDSGQQLRLIPLGGVGGVTKNMYIYELGNDIIVVDCGVGFPDEGMPGVDLVIPDTTYLKDKKNKIKAFVITHAHEDHIGSLPFIWPDFQVPIYAPRLAAGFIRAKFAEHKLPKNKINEVKIDDKLTLGAFNLSFYRVSHSVPDATGVVIKTPVGTIVHQADFKIDWTPVSGQVTDVAKAAQVGATGVKMLLIDCLRIEREGFNKSEKTIQRGFERVVGEAENRVFITMTSSNVSRIQQALNVAQKFDRKVALVGRSFESNFQVCRDLGYLHVPPGLVIAPEAVASFARQKVLVLIAGSQGQPESALSRAASGEHRHVRIDKGDTVIFSADPIPSSEAAQDALIDSLSKMGADVYYSAIAPDLHISGHAAADEIKTMVNLIKPEYLMPIGGTFRHMRYFAKVFNKMGYSKDKILVGEDGDVVEVTKGLVKFGQKIETKNVFVDGLGVGDVGNVVLRDRQVMSDDGIVVVILPVDAHSGQIVGEPDVISRGFVFEKQSEELLSGARNLLKQTLSQHSSQMSNWRFVRESIQDNLEKYLYKETERRPLILPVVMQV